jgi:hypothetical protein
VLTVLVERHRLGGASLDLSRPAFDLFVPGSRRIGVAFVVQAADQLERQLRARLGGKPEDLGQHVGRGYVPILADSFEPRNVRSDTTRTAASRRLGGSSSAAACPDLGHGGRLPDARACNHGRSIVLKRPVVC